MLELAAAVLMAVADGRGESVQLADHLAAHVLAQEEMRRAVQLRRLLDAQSPFALVRAVELAEHLLLCEERRAKACR